MPSLSLLAWLRRSGVYLAIGIVAIVVYGLTIAPSLTWSHWGSDGGDLATAAVTGRVPHPPGFPVYFLVTRALVSFVPGDPARVLACLSAVAAGGTALMIAAAIRRQGLPDWVVLASALALLLSSWFWSQALIAEVYATAALFAGWVVLMGESVGTRGSTGWAVTGLSLGLATSVHPTVIFLFPYTVLSGRCRWQTFVPGLLVGLIPYALLPLSGPWPQPWGDLSSVAGWFSYVTGRIYWGNAFSLPLASWPARLLAWAVLSARQFTPVGAVLILLGVAKNAHDRRRLAGALSSLALVTLYAIGYNAPDSWVYLVAFLPLAAVYLARGLQWVVDQGMPAALSVLVPIALLALNLRTVSLASDRQALNWLEDALGHLPAKAMVLTSDDRYTFALWYGSEAVRMRPDLLVVDTRLWGFPPYDEFLRRGEGGLPADTLEELAKERPLCTIDIEGKVICS